MPKIPKDFPVQPLKPGQEAKEKMTCGTCGLSWDDAIPTSLTPAPAARCPFEYYHDDEPALDRQPQDFKDPFIVVNLSTTVPVEGEPFQPERSPSGLSLDETGAGQVAASLVRTLDKRFTREQVHSIARWMRYLSTQS